MRILTRVPELNQICSRVSVESLRQCLRKYWIDTNIMDCWFEILKANVPRSHFFPSGLAHWEQKNLTDYYCIKFGKEGLKEYSEYQMLFFPIWYQSHFFPPSWISKKRKMGVL